MPQSSHPTPSPLVWRVPSHVLLATAVFLLIQISVVLGLRGVAAPEVYPADFTKYIPVNTVDDDAVINMAAILNAFSSPQDRYSALINLGGPVLLLGRGVVSLAGHLGLVRVFDDPALYISYPHEYQKIWTLFGLLKAIVFLSWFPIVVYWIGRNHFSPRAGDIGAWFIAAIPFVTGFDARMKADSTAIIAGLFALLFLFQYLKDGRLRTLALASAFLALSLSIKLLMLPAGILLLLAIYLDWRRGGTPVRALMRRLVLSGAFLVGTFFVANPLALGSNGIPALFRELGRSSVYFKYVPPVTDQRSLFELLLYQFTHLDAFLGTWLGLLTPALLVFCLVRLSIRRKPFQPDGLLALLIALNFTYLAVLAFPLLTHTYLYYQPAVFMLILAADGCAVILEYARSKGRLPHIVIFGLLALLTGLTFRQDLEVLGYLRSTTNRQLAHGFLRQHAKTGDSVGIPVNPDNETFSSFFAVDPFVYRLCKVGPNGERLDSTTPDWLLWIFQEKGSPTPRNPSYLPAALYENGKDLPHQEYNLYQEQPYAVYARTGPPKAGQACDEDLLFSLGEFVRADRQPAFNILQFQALPLRPQSLDLFRKAGNTILPLPTQSFARGVRDRSSALSYVHQVDRLTLAFWGVKYLVAHTGDGVVAKETLGSHRFDFEPAGSLPHGVDIYRNKDYRGQALFLEAAHPGEVRTLRPPRFIGWLRPLKDWGTLYKRSDIAASDFSALEITIRIDAREPVDILLKGGAYRRSLLSGRGEQVLVATYETGDGTEDIGYEMHPTVKGSGFTVKSIEAKPLRIAHGDRLSLVSSDPHASFATERSAVPGAVVFSQPFLDCFWRAYVDGQPADPRRGPANTVAVDVPAGEHLVSLFPRP